MKKGRTEALLLFQTNYLALHFCSADLEKKDGELLKSSTAKLLSSHFTNSLFP